LVPEFLSFKTTVVATVVVFHFYISHETFQIKNLLWYSSSYIAIAYFVIYEWSGYACES